jgi:hypothetical protein
MMGRAALVVVVTSAGCLVKPEATGGDARTCFPWPVGNASLDSDGDGVTDELDNCPNDSNTSQHDEDHDCRGDACDLCPHLPVDPDAGDVDQDGIGDLCDADLAAADHLFFDPFVTRPASWSTEANGGNWQLGGDSDSFEQAQPSASPGYGVFDQTLPLVTSGSIETVLHVNADVAVDLERTFSTGMIFNFAGDCAANCSGQAITLTRDLVPASRLWFRLSAIGPGPTFTTTAQLPVNDVLDADGVRIELTWGSGHLVAFLTMHGTRLGPLMSAANTGSFVGLVTENTGASFDHVTIIY